MKASAANSPSSPDQHPGKSTGRRWLVLAPMLVLLGAVLAGIWFKCGQTGTSWFAKGQGNISLSDRVRDELGSLRAPVELRFYAVLPPDSASESLRDFAGRVDNLLTAFQGANEKQIHVVRNISTADTNVEAASADGLQAFNLEKGNACFLGITVASGGRKETLARIRPEWEGALPFDLARAILQVAGAPATAGAGQSQKPPVSSETTNIVLRLIPDVASTSLEEGARILRNAAVQEIMAAATEADSQIQLAKQQLADAQNSASETQQQAARKHLQEVQFQQTEKIRTIAARLEEELSVFQQMKTTAAGNGSK